MSGSHCELYLILTISLWVRCCEQEPQRGVWSHPQWAGCWLTCRSIHTAGEILTINVWPGYSTGLVMCIFFTRGGLDLCSLAPTQPSAALLHQSTHSAPTCNSTDVDFYTDSSSDWSAKITQLRLSGSPTRISWGRCSPSGLLPGTSHLQMWCHWLRD